MKKLALLLLPIALLCGCAREMVPRTSIKGAIAGIPFEVTSPKNMDLGSLTLTAKPNGEVSLSITNLSTRMDPEVISMSGKAFTEAITAAGEVAIKAVGAAKP